MYKTIVVHVDAASAPQACIAIAAALARDWGAHLIGLTRAGVARVRARHG